MVWRNAWRQPAIRRFSGFYF